MKKNIIAYLKIYVIWLIVLLISALVYALILYKSDSLVHNHYLNSLIIGSISFVFLGFLIGNHQQKKGFLLSFSITLITLLIILAIKYLLNETINTMLIIKMIIYLLTSSIFGILGVNIKKII